MRRIEKLTRMIKSEDESNGYPGPRASGASHLGAPGAERSRQGASMKTHTLSSSKIAALTDSLQMQKGESEQVVHQDTDALLKI